MMGKDMMDEYAKMKDEGTLSALRLTFGRMFISSSKLSPCIAFHLVDSGNHLVSAD